LYPFTGLQGTRHHAPATPGDLLFHLRAESLDFCFELATQVLTAMGGAVTVVDEVHGFRFFDNRDLLGFVDGTENPEGTQAAGATEIGAEDPDFAGGCYVHVQKYVHDMAAWQALSVPEQERVIGRTKLEDIELADDVKPANSHVALNVVEDANGNQLQIVRANMPFGSVGAGEYGTYYIGYSRTPAVTEKMLHNMFIGNPVGNTDRILDFSTAVTGTLFFTPTADFLDNPPPLPGSGATTASPARAAAPDGSLGIGSMKGRSR
jgi:putative iron-dependent peroxidase